MRKDERQPAEPNEDKPRLSVHTVPFVPPLCRSRLGVFRSRFRRLLPSLVRSSKTASLAVISKEEEQQHCRHGHAQNAPESCPMHSIFVTASIERPTGAKIAQQISESRGHQRHERLSSRAPGRLEPFINVNLRGDEEESEGQSVQRHTDQDRGQEVQRAKTIQ